MNSHTKSLFSVLNPIYFSFILLNARKRKKRKKTKILKKIEAGELGIDVLPRSREVEYCDRFSKITAMLPADRSTTTISYEDLLKLHMAPVHIDDHELCLMECLMSCSQKQMCRNIRNALIIAEFIKEQLGVKDRLFKTLQKPNVVGSLRENSRLFSLDEMDATPLWAWMVVFSKSVVLTLRT